MKPSLIPYSNHHYEDCAKLFNTNMGKYFSAEEEGDYLSFLKRLTNEDKYYVVQENDLIIAAGGVAEDGDHVVLTWGMVSRELHGKGIGDFLTSARLEQIAKHYPEKIVQIETSQHTAGFYNRHGFRTHLKTPDGFGAGIDKIVMTLSDSDRGNSIDESQFQTNLILEGETLSLRPLVTADFERLYEVAADPEIWAMHPASDRYKADVFRGYFDSGINSGMAFIIVNKETGEVIGSSRYNAPDYNQSSIEIGWTFLARHYWGGKYNAELKHLMIRHAFDTFDKVHFCIGANNYRSISAVKKLGAYHQPDILDAARPESVIYELTSEKYHGKDGYGK